MERKLAAILAADIAGYSRLMGENEATTLAAVRAVRNEIIEPAIVANRGRLVKTTGDGFLVEFASAVDAVACALAWQEAMAIRTNQPRLAFRIGINLGDVVVEDGDLFGDGVNIAARLEAEAPVGGLCISDSLHQNIAGRIDVAFMDGGEVQLKNIARKVRIWRWTAADEAQEVAEGKGGRARKFQSFFLAVLPFKVLGQQEQAYLGESLAEALTTELGRFGHFKVISAQQSFMQRGNQADVTEIGRKLGARYLVSGSIQIAGPRARVNVQLTDTATGAQVWAKTYDGNPEDAFTFQDEMSRQITANINMPLMDYAMNRSKGGGGDEAFEYFMRSYYAVEHPTSDNIEDIKRYALKVIEIDPGFAVAYENLAWYHLHRTLGGWCADPVAELKEARTVATKGVSVDPKEAYTRVALGVSECLLGNTAVGLKTLAEALPLNPYDVEVVTFVAWGHAIAGNQEKALEGLAEATNLSPGYAPGHLFTGESCYALERYEEALEHFDAALLQLPDYHWALVGKTACLSALSRANEAKDVCKNLMTASPFMSLSYLSALLKPQGPQWVARLKEHLATAGLPEARN